MTVAIRRGTVFAAYSLAIAAAIACGDQPRGDARSGPAAPRVEPAKTARKPNVVLLSIDTLRADALGSYGRAEPTSPALDRLARDGVRFANAYSTSSWTPPAMASLMTALYPVRHGVTSGRVVPRQQEGGVRREVAGQQVLPEDLTVLAQLLQRAGYRTYGITTNAHLEGELGFARGFDRYECLGFTEAERLLAAFDAIAPEISAGAAPYFLWLHLFDPHSPYFPNRSWLDTHAAHGKRFRELEGITPPERYRDLGVVDGERLEYVKALYHGEVSHTDAAVARVLQRLGADDDALIVVVSDHGEEFLEHGRFGHAHDLYEETVRIPMIVRLPGRRFAGSVVHGAVSLVDVLPTVAAAAGVAVPAELDGRSLLPRIERPAAASAVPVFAELGRDHPLKMVLADGFKLIYDVDSPQRTTLYDLTADASERTDLAAVEPQRAARLTTLLRERIGLTAEAGRATRTHPLSQREVEALKSMGYVQ